ncbi:MAG: hypothetical protein H6591_10010 [Flavobacteriales bacterium]|nr:hypothetical protein [Flavobacteriales bacterium]
MRLGLPENAREAVQFLALGAGIVLGIRVVIALLGSLPASPEDGSLTAALAPYRADYPLLPAQTVAVEAQAPLPRIAIASLLVLLSGAAFGLLGGALGALLRKRPLALAVLLARGGLLLAMAWALFCLLARPARSTTIASDGLHLHEHVCFLGSIPLPFGEHERIIPWRDAMHIAVAEEPGTSACGTTIVITAQVSGVPVPIAMQPVPVSDCAREIALQRANAAIIVREIKAVQRQHL